MPPRILALRLTLVQSNSAILIGSLDSGAAACATGVSALAAASTKAPIDAVEIMLRSDMLVLLSSSGEDYRSFPCSFLIVLEKLVVAQARGRHKVAVTNAGAEG